MNTSTVLIVDDDAEIRELIAMYLRDHNIQTIEAADGDTAIRQCQAYRPDLVILDVILPGMDGFTVSRHIRELSAVPIIFLTSKWEAEDIVTGLTIGGDDYMTKPFLPNELVARVQLHLRKTTANRMSDVIRYDDLVIHRDTYEACYRGQSIPFLAKEFRLFQFLAERPRKVFSAEQLYERLWDMADGDIRTVMVHISNIRKKLALYARDVVRIETIKGMGYRFVTVNETTRRPQTSNAREAILSAAAALFAERGYEGMTIKEVAKLAGLSASSIYAHFRNKEDLFLYIYRGVLSGHQQLVVDNVSNPDPRTAKDQLDEVLRSVIQYQLKDASKMKIYIRILLFPRGYFEQDMKAELLKVEKMELEYFAGIFKMGIERGEIRGSDPDALAKLLLCLMDGWFWEMQRKDGEAFLTRFDQVWEQFWELVKA